MDNMKPILNSTIERDREGNSIGFITIEDDNSVLTKYMYLFVAVDGPPELFKIHMEHDYKVNGLKYFKRMG